MNISNDQVNEITEETPFGRELAGQVSDGLDNCPLMHRHKEFSGMGIAKLADGGFAYGEVHDANLRPQKKFNNRQELVDWLSKQSDKSLAYAPNGDRLVGDEALTRERLMRYVKYSPNSTAGDF